LSQAAKDALAESPVFMRPEDLDVYDPRPNQRVPKPGAWAMIVRPLPPLERGLHEEVTPGRCFWVTHQGGADEHGFAPDGRYKVLTNTPWGEVALWPYEYTVIPPERLIAYWTEEALQFHPLDMESAQFNAIVFYARSRGIGLADAAVMALGTLSGRVGWFEPHPDLAAWMEGVAARLHEPLGARRRRRV